MRAWLNKRQLAPKQTPSPPWKPPSPPKSSKETWVWIPSSLLSLPFLPFGFQIPFTFSPLLCSLLPFSFFFPFRKKQREKKDREKEKETQMVRRERRINCLLGHFFPVLAPSLSLYFFLLSQTVWDKENRERIFPAKSLQSSVVGRQLLFCSNFFSFFF